MPQNTSPSWGGRYPASHRSVSASRAPVSGSSVVSAQRGSSRTTVSTASPARTRRPTQASSAWASHPSISRVGRKRRASRCAPAALAADLVHRRLREQRDRVGVERAQAVVGAQQPQRHAGERRHRLGKGAVHDAGRHVAAPELDARPVHGRGHLAHDVPPGSRSSSTSVAGVVAARHLGEHRDVALGGDAAGAVDEHEPAIVLDSVGPDRSLLDRGQVQRLDRRDVDRAHSEHRGR